MRAGGAIGGGDAGKLRAFQPAGKGRALVGGAQLPPPPVLGAGALGDKRLGDQALHYPIEALLGDAQNPQELAHRQPGSAVDEMERPLVRPAKPHVLKRRVGGMGKNLAGEEHELDAAAQLLLAQEQAGDGGFRFAHIDTMGGCAYQPQ